MTIQQGQVITYNDYSSLKAKVDSIYGTGSGDKGYGQTVTSPSKSQNSIISAAEWNALRHDMIACRQHQTGSTIGTSTALDGLNLVEVVQNTPITYAITHQYDTFADVITTDRFLIASGQYTDSSLGEQTTANAWNGTLNHTFTFNATSEQFRFFFNAGGQISISINPSPILATPKDTFWYDLVSTVNYLWMDYTTTETNGSGRGLNIGYNDLTEADQIIYQFYGSYLTAYDGTEFANNSCIIYAKKTNTTVVFTISFSDTVTSGTDPNVTLLPTSLAFQRRPTGSNVSVTGLSVTGGTSGGTAVPQVSMNSQYGIQTKTISWSITGGVLNGTYTVTTQTGASFNGQITPYTLDSSGAANQTITLIPETVGTYTLTFTFSDGQQHIISNYLIKYYVDLQISSTETNLNLYDRASSSGTNWFNNTTSPVYIDVVVQSGKIIGSTNTSTFAFSDTTPVGLSWPNNSEYHLTVQSGAFIVGAGGNGGASNSNGGEGVASQATHGGPAMDLTGTNISKYIINNGTIGGGGGGGGASSGAGWPYHFYSGTPVGGGGGGAGYTPGTGSFKGGAGGTTSTGGAGGSYGGRPGGSGGDLGQFGSSGTGGNYQYNSMSNPVYQDGGLGGNPGVTITGYSTITTIVNNGVILGTVV